MTTDRDHWTAVAAEWIAWAGTPNHDAFWSHRPALLDFIGPGPGQALDIGCGEGRIARLLKSLGYHVTASDPVPQMIAAAKRALSADAYVIAAGTHLPFPPDSFDLITAYNVLMDVQDLPTTVHELRRVLRPTGTLVISIVHPFADRGRFASSAPASPFVIQDSYFDETRFEGTEQRDGLTMHFAGWSRPLEAYATALENAGLAITALREPIPRPGAAHTQPWTRIPLFLWLKAQRHAAPTTSAGSAPHNPASTADTSGYAATSSPASPPAPPP